MSRTKWIVLLLLATMALWFACARLAAGKAQGVKFRTAKVERSDLVSTVSATGTLNAVTTVQVGSQLSGIIQKLHVDFNSVVKTGELLAELDPATFAATVAQVKADVLAARTAVTAAQTDLKSLDAEVASAEAGIASARAGVRKAEVLLADRELLLKRTQALAAKNFAAAQDLDTARANRNTAVAEVEAARAAISQAESRRLTALAQRANGDSKVEQARAQLSQRQAALDMASVNLERTRIFSPIDGVVVSRSIDVGQTVAASFQAPVLFTIANDLRRMQINANVDEADIGRVQVGQTVEFTVDAYPDERFPGKVVQIRLQPIVTQNVVTYDTVIEVANEKLLLRPGMTASVYIQTAHAKGVLKLPNGATSYRPASVPATGATSATVDEPRQPKKGHKLVYVPDGTGTRALEVEIGISDASYTEVRAGTLKEGELVIIGDDSDGAKEEAGVTNPFAPRKR
jgi:HlyD family secretion protein